MISHRTLSCRFVQLLVAGLLLSATAHAATKTWSGTTSANWNTGTNWVGGFVPANGDSVVFPNGGGNLATNNDIAGLSLASITFSANSYSISGNAITLTGGMSNTGDNSIATNITLNNAGQTFTMNSGTLTISGVISGASTGFTKDGTGTLILSGTNTYSGVTTVSAGTLTVSGSIGSSSVNLTGGTLSGSGTIGGFTADSNSTLAVKLNGTTPGTGYDQFNVNGTVAAGGTLSATLGFASANGDAFTIINNDGADVVSGQFTNLPEGSTVTIGSESFTLSYTGGTGNDVVLTHVVTISGRVTDKDGNAVIGISVSDGTRSATTGNDGSYIISGVPNGSYTVTPTLTGRLFQPASASVTVASGSMSGINFKLLGTPTDIDGDGFSDAVETAAGTNPSDSSSTPFSGLAAPAPESLTLSKLQIKLNFSIFLKGPSDSLSFAGSLPVAAGFSPTGQQVICDVGGVIRVFNLTDKGISPKGDDSFKLNKPGKDNTAKYSAKFSKGTFVDSFKDELLRGTIDAKNEDRQVVVTVYFTDRVFTKTCDIIWNARAFKTGSAKLKIVR